MTWRNSTNWLSDKPIGEWSGVTTDKAGRVAELDLEDNELRGRIPPELGGLTSLTRLNLADNFLLGPIPPELGSLIKLSSLRLSWNVLGGPIPAELGYLASLQELYLDGNLLRGPIPAWLGSPHQAVVADPRVQRLERGDSG